MRFRLTSFVLLLCTLAACQSPSVRQNTLPPANPSAGDGAAQRCAAHANDTVDKLEACITRASLWRRLSAFQRIADEHPGTQGHGNRDTGTPGYAASVAYVARLMRAAGYDVTIQRYRYRNAAAVASPDPGWTHRRIPIDRDWLAQARSDYDYNVIAESRFGDASRTVVVDAHLDSIYGAGMLDNASGSTTILEIALNMAKTPTRNRLRYVWFGGEELGLLGSRYYTAHLTPAQLRRIVFDLDVDVTATPNFDILIADPKYATKVKRFPKNVVPQSRIGNDDFADYFKAAGVVSQPARFGNNGTDSFAFSLAGVPNSGILTQQDCCKHDWEVDRWGGFRGNYEGKLPGWNGGCVDYPHRWCDNLSNNDAFVLELASKAVAYVTLELANRKHFPGR
ncbi:MAG: M28 family peptidase [Candidatus Eremiobacteraeota bacterium]|nr:M28 family peptidase [Candidatus Eremiobacteraeota bacterium]